jgi:hypothetical protein
MPHFRLAFCVPPAWEPPLNFARPRGTSGVGSSTVMGPPARVAFASEATRDNGYSGFCRSASAVCRKGGAGEGNRTLVISLEGCCSTIELHPRLRQGTGTNRQRSEKTGLSLNSNA